MRKILIALTALTVALSLAGAASAQSVTTVRALPGQPGCTAQTAGAGHIAYLCGGPDGDGPTVTLAARITSLTGIVQSTVSALAPAVPAEIHGVHVWLGGSFARGLGRRWLHLLHDCLGSCAGWTQDVDWRTGESHQIATLDPRLREDLDARSLTVPLCAPLRSDMSTAMSVGASTAVVLERPWALLVTGRYPGPAAAWTVRRCGSARPVAVPPGSRPLALGGGWVLMVDDHRGTVQALRLADRRLVTIAGVPPSMTGLDHDHIALTSGRAVFVLEDDAGTHRVLTVRLPTKLPGR